MKINIMYLILIVVFGFIVMGISYVYEDYFEG